MVALAPGSDTPPEIERMMIELWRRATPGQKLDKMSRMARELNELTRAEIRGRYPAATPREVELRLASRTIDRDTMIKAFGWDPDIQGR